MQTGPKESLLALLRICDHAALVDGFFGTAEKQKDYTIHEVSTDRVLTLFPKSDAAASEIPDLWKKVVEDYNLDTGHTDFCKIGRGVKYIEFSLILTVILNSSNSIWRNPLKNPESPKVFQ